MTGKKILIAENDEDMLLLLGQGLSKHGYEVQAINNTLDIFNKSFICPDLFILDHQMEFSDGIAVCKYLRLRSESRNTPILMISNDLQKRNDAMNVGVNYFLHKPFYLESLLGIISQLITDNGQRGA
ncbi:MAG TPA: response regulator [Chryseolinea sp.]|nr:response regulator [Chryseolinea sp.]